MRCHPEIPITIAGTDVPSLTIHQLLLSTLSRASSSSSCRKMGTFCNLRSLITFIIAEGAQNCVRSAVQAAREDIRRHTQGGLPVPFVSARMHLKVKYAPEQQSRASRTQLGHVGRRIVESEFPTIIPDSREHDPLAAKDTDGTCVQTHTPCTTIL